MSTLQILLLLLAACALLMAAWVHFDQEVEPGEGQ